MSWAIVQSYAPQVPPHMRPEQVTAWTAYHAGDTVESIADPNYDAPPPEGVLQGGIWLIAKDERRCPRCGQIERGKQL